MRGLLKTAGLAAALLLLALPLAARAEGVLFTVASADGKTRFPVTDAIIETIGTKTIDAEPPSFERPRVKARGPLLRDVLTAAGLTGRTILVRALDDYEMEIPAEDFAANAVILAIEIDGKRIGPRERGPAWILYPAVDQPRFKGDLYQARSVWQVKDIVVR